MRALLLAILAACVLAPAAQARRHDPEKLPETRIRDLHFGDVLFLYFQNDDAHDFEALTRLLAYEHWIVRPADLSRLNAAFFNVNGYISLLFFFTWGADLLIH